MSILYSHRKFNIISVSLLLILSSFLYLRIFSLFPFYEDVVYIRSILDSSSWTKYVGYIGHVPLIRPIERIINILNLHISNPLNNYFSHLISFIGFLCSSILVFDIAKKIFKDHFVYVIAASLLFVLHPINVVSVYEMDIISQLYATVFLLFFFRWLLSHDFRNTKKYILTSLFFTCLTILSKDTSLGVLIALPVCAYIIRVADGDKCRRKHFLYTLCIIFIVELLYLLIRHSYINYIGNHLDSRYFITISTNIFINISLYLGSLLYMGTTSDLFLYTNKILVLISIVLSSLFLLIILYGAYVIFNQKDVKDIYIGSALFILIVAGSFPALLINKIAERYSYTSSPFFCLLAALLFTKCYLHASTLKFNVKYNYPLSRFLVLLFIMLLLWMGYSTNIKLTYIEKNSDKVKKLFAAISNWRSGKNFDKSFCLPMKQASFPKRQHSPFVDHKSSDHHVTLTRDHYSPFVIDDEVVWYGVVLYNIVNYSDIKVLVQEDSESCRYLISQGNDPVFNQK